jgi:ATP-dependent helicase/nuclease subunit A
MKAGGIDAPAVQDVNAVKLLTVHGAKGLEADIVLLLDSDAPPQRTDTMSVVVEWPGDAPSPWRYSFIASESRPPPCHAEALEVERGLRQREELNMLYVAMTRARRELVISSVAPRSVNEGSWWRRLEAHAEPVAVPEAKPLREADTQSRFELLQVPALPARAQSAGVPAQDSLDSRMGQAMHLVLELMRPGAQFPAGHVKRIARRFDLTADEAQEAARRAQRIAQGEGSWAWDPSAIDWHANEVPLHHEGTLLRIDRLVRRGGEWWVLDYKSAPQPQLQAGLVEQMQRYRVAVQAIHPAAKVHAAFLTGEGRVVLVP